jgi:glycosyltransferase involved in cell wall biosynthesis
MTGVAGSGPVRVVRVISRLNVGGPAIQAITLSKLLEPRGYETTLVRGTEGPREGNMDDLAEELGIQPLRVAALRRELGVHDIQALAALTRIIRRERPQILHTHAAKGGAIGRLAAALAGRSAPPVRVHTFHGHVLTDYFSPWKAGAFARVERRLARTTTRLVAVSSEVRDDLVRLGVADSSVIAVVPLGFDLSRFDLSPEAAERARTETRARLGIPEDARVATLVARFVPIKRVDRFLRVALRLRDVPNVVFLVVGDGELTSEIRSSDEARALGGQVLWAGLQRDMPGILHASDVVAQTSDNEGTPVTLIEAQAAARPVVSTNVGGVASAVRDGVTGRLAGREDEAALAAAVRELLTDRELGSSLGSMGRRHVLEHFSLTRLVDDLDLLYRRLLREAANGRATPPFPR